MSSPRALVLLSTPPLLHSTHTRCLRLLLPHGTSLLSPLRRACKASSLCPSHPPPPLPPPLRSSVMMIPAWVASQTNEHVSSRQSQCRPARPHHSPVDISIPAVNSQCSLLLTTTKRRKMVSRRRSLVVVTISVDAQWILPTPLPAWTHRSLIALPPLSTLAPPPPLSPPQCSPVVRSTTG
jgi:hypothetical protein